MHEGKTKMCILLGFNYDLDMVCFFEYKIRVSKCVLYF